MLHFLFGFRGRLTRTRNALSLLGLPLLLWLAPFVARVLAERISVLGPAGALSAVTALIAVVVLVLLALTVRRLHDIGTTGFWAVGLLVPWVSWAFYLLILLWPGQAGANRHGPDPRPELPDPEPPAS
jgi:uncharacterized membrane protein YhaH (DUF805 family)